MKNSETLESILKNFKLTSHPEGGSYQESYRSEFNFNNRSASTAIYFLLEKGEFSSFHRIKSDEMWHFYLGGPLEVIEIDKLGEAKFTILGHDLNHNQKLQHLVPANTWFASRPLFQSDFSFVGCTVSPGFEFLDFELAHRNELIKIYPQHQNLIIALTR